MRFTRFTAFAVHLGISLVIFIALLLIVVFDWYRFPLFAIEGGWKGIQIIAGCDIVLGPLLTLIVFRPGKPSLKFDMSVIALIQVAALVSGTWIAYLQRPVLMVYAEERFYTLSNDIVGMAGIKPEEISRYNNTPYPLAVVRLPDDEEQRHKLRMGSAARGGLYLRGDLYAEQIPQFLADAQAHSLDMEKYTADKPADHAELERFKSRHGALEAYYFLPLHGRYGRMIVALDRNTGHLVDKLDIKPPEA
jgi:hypothetical protein